MNSNVCTVGKIGENPVTLGSVLSRLRISGELHSLVQAAIDHELMQRAATELQIEVSVEALQEKADVFRRVHGLHSAKQTSEWLDNNGLTVDEFQSFLSGTLLKDAIIENVLASQVEPYFAEHRKEYDAADISQVVVENPDVAEELKEQIVQEEATLEEIAAKHSTDSATKEKSGHMGLVSRRLLNAQIETPVFTSKKGNIEGPIRTDTGYHLLRINAIYPGELNEEVRAEISEKLFEEWIAGQRKAYGAEVNLPISFDL